MEPKIDQQMKKKIAADELIIFPYCIVHKYEELNHTVILGSLSKICCTKLDLLQDIRKFYGELFDVYVFLKCERRHQSVSFNPLASQCLL